MPLIIFDVDGTLVDSQHEIVAAQGIAFTAHGLPAPSRERALSVVGLSLTEAFAALVGADGPIDSLAEAYKAAWLQLRGTPSYSDRLYPGAADTLAVLAGLPGVQLGIATGKSRRGLDRIITAQNWGSYFTTIQVADDHPSKPHPSMIRAAMHEAGASALSTIMIGDTTYDIEMAVAAGVRPIGVAWGYHPADDLAAAGATDIVPTFANLLALLRQLLELR